MLAKEETEEQVDTSGFVIVLNHSELRAALRHGVSLRKSGEVVN